MAVMFCVFFFQFAKIRFFFESIAFFLPNEKKVVSLQLQKWTDL